MSKVTGFRETARALRRVAQFPRKKVSAASRKALAPMLRATKANLRANGSYHRGVLSRSLRVRKLKGTSSLSQYVIAPTGRGIGIAHLVELGTHGPYWQPKRKQMHPGSKAKPYMEPAYQAHDDEAIRIVGQELGVGMIRYAQSVGYKGR